MLEIGCEKVEKKSFKQVSSSTGTSTSCKLQCPLFEELLVNVSSIMTSSCLRAIILEQRVSCETKVN